MTKQLGALFRQTPSSLSWVLGGPHHRVVIGGARRLGNFGAAHAQPCRSANPPQAPSTPARKRLGANLPARFTPLNCTFSKIRLHYSFIPHIPDHEEGYVTSS